MTSSESLRIACVLATVLFNLHLPAQADVKMPAIFGDHMVLQQATKIPVWGNADPGESVLVMLGANNATAIADAQGNWQVQLPPQTANGSTSVTLTVKGKNTLTFQDVLVGDVWIGSGQSNMGLSVLDGRDGVKEAAQAANPQIRLFQVTRMVAPLPMTDIVPTTPDRPFLGAWQVCSPDRPAQHSIVGGFSAVAYYFARDIAQVTGQPVGIIATSWGGTPGQAWTPLDALEAAPQLKHYATDAYHFQQNYDAAKAKFVQDQTDFPALKQKWDQEVGAPYKDALAQWQTLADQAKAAGQPAPPKPAPASPAPVKPKSPDEASNTPTGLFNGMVAPLIPYAIKGVVWYQGESNESTGVEYRTLFKSLITSWRTKWGQGDFPFLFVQLANYGHLEPPPAGPSGGLWPWVREAQGMALALPNTGMAVTIDIGDPGNIHPKDKQDVAARLALAARHVAYGQDLVFSGPTYDSIKIENNSIRISFKNIGGGLVMGVPPWTANGQPVPTPTELTGFGIAGADKKWVAAKAAIDGDTVVVSSDAVPNPVAVRYGWTPNPPCDLYNKDGLPASPFRSDDWDR